MNCSKDDRDPAGIGHPPPDPAIGDQVRHELRTPLNAVIGFAEALESGCFGPVNDKQAEYLRDIQASGRRLLTVVEKLLAAKT